MGWVWGFTDLCFKPKAHSSCDASSQLRSILNESTRRRWLKNSIEADKNSCYISTFVSNWWHQFCARNVALAQSQTIEAILATSQLLSQDGGIWQRNEKSRTTPKSQSDIAVDATSGDSNILRTASAINAEVAKKLRDKIYHEEQQYEIVAL